MGKRRHLRFQIKRDFCKIKDNLNGKTRANKVWGDYLVSEFILKRVKTAQFANMVLKVPKSSRQVLTGSKTLESIYTRSTFDVSYDQEDAPKYVLPQKLDLEIKNPNRIVQAFDCS